MTKAKEPEMRQIELRLAIVRYVDLCRHTSISKERFLAEAGLKTMELVGFVVDLGDLIKVLYENDVSDDEECDGMVIPKSCVEEIVYLKEDEVENFAKSDVN